MPYSKKHNVLFIHIPKNGGKSFEVAMEIASKEEVLKYKWRSFFNKIGKYIIIKTKDKKALRRLWGVHDTSLTLQHVTLQEIQILNILDKKIVANSTKVAIIRNPFDRAVSSYHHMRLDENESFLEFIKRYFSAPPKNHNDLAHKRKQNEFIKDINGKIIIDNIIKYENLSEDFEKFKKEHSFDCKCLPHIGKQNRRNLSYKDYYCDLSYKLIENIFKSDLDEFNYKF